MRTPEQRAVDHDGTAEAGAERDDGEALRTAAGTDPGLAERGEVDVVLDQPRLRDTRREPGTQVEAVPAEVEAAGHPSGDRVEEARDADRHGGDGAIRCGGALPEVGEGGEEDVGGIGRPVAAAVVLLRATAPSRSARTAWHFVPPRSAPRTTGSAGGTAPPAGRLRAHRPRKSTPAGRRSADSSVTSARDPGRRAPTPSRPSRPAGTLVAAATAACNGIPATVTAKRTASARVSVLPAIVPSAFLRHAGLDRHLPVAQGVGAVGHAGAGHGVGDEQGAARPRGRAGRAARTAGWRCTPSAISSTTASDSSSATTGPGLAVVHGPHRVEQVRAGAGTPVQRRPGLLVRRVGVPDGHHHSGRHQLLDGGQAARQLRRERHHAHGAVAGGEQPGDVGRVGEAQRGRGRARPPAAGSATAPPGGRRPAARCRTSGARPASCVSRTSSGALTRLATLVVVPCTRWKWTTSATSSGRPP